MLGIAAKILRLNLGFVLPGLLLLALACSQATSQPASPEPIATPGEAQSSGASSVGQSESDASPTPEAVSRLTRESLRVPTKPPPDLDTSIASVPLQEVIFDTFDGGAIALSSASKSTIERLRDLIKPIYIPKYGPVGEGDWLRDTDLVIGYASQSGEAFAYPIKILNFHEIVNDVIDGVPVLVSYCPLCASGVVYSRELDGDILLFGNTSALYESDLVMFDHQTGSYWFQVLGEAIVGPLTRKRLTMLPSRTTTWGQWKELHPDTQVLSRDLGLGRGGSYDRDPFVGFVDRVNRGQFAFPVSEEKLDDRLRPGDKVIGIQVGESHKAYPLTGRPDEVINDEVGGEKVVVIVRADGPTGFAYLSTLDGQTLTFSLDDGVLQDAGTGSAWDDGGRAISGPMAGAQLTPVPLRTSFWFSLVGSLPGIELYTP